MSFVGLCHVLKLAASEKTSPSHRTAIVGVVAAKIAKVETALVGDVPF